MVLSSDRFRRRIQPIDATQALNLAVGIAGEAEQLFVRDGVLQIWTEGEHFCGPADEPLPHAESTGAISYKEVFLLIEAMELKIAAYRKECESLVDGADDEKLSDIGNDLMYLEAILPRWRSVLASFQDPQ